MIKNDIIFTLVSVFFATSLLAQEPIKGFVENDKKKPIENASVVIKDFSENIIAYSFTNDKGFFLLTNSSKNINELKLVVNSLGYQEKSIILDKNQKIFNIFLLEKPLQLNEVVLESNQKISSKSNVTTLKIKYFIDETEQTVEDVLKKIPGVEVLEDGSIKAHGKYISKLLIEGDDLFDNNYQILSKNLDAKVLDAVEIIDAFQDNPVLAKVMDSDMVALNLKLKEDFKNIWFGNTTLGLGNEERLKLSLNLGLLRKKIKFFYFNDYNNLGNKASNQLDGATTSLNLSSFYQEQRIEPKIKPLYTIEKNESNLFNNGESTFNKAFINSLGFVTKLTSKLELRGTGAFSSDNQNQQFFAETLFNVDTTPISITENSNTNHKNKMGSGELEFKYTGGTRSYLKNTFVYNNQPERYKNNIINNDNIILQNINQNNFSIYNHLNYSYALSKKNVLHNYIYLGQNQIKQNTNIQSPVLNNLFSFSEDENIKYLSNNNMNIFGVSSNLFSTFGNFKHNLNLEYKSLKEEHTTELLNKNNLDSLQNRLNFKTNETRLTSDLSYSFSKKVKLSLGASINYVKIDIGNQLKEDWIFNPELRLDLRKLKIGLFRISYKNTFDLPQSFLFLNNYQLNSYRSFTKGSNAIVFIKIKKTNVFYKWSNKLESQAFTLQLSHDEYKKNYSTTSQISENFIYSSFGVYIGNRRLSANINFTSYFKKLNLSTNLKTNQTWSVTPFQINNQDTSSNLRNHLSSYLFSGTTYFKLPINFTFKINLNKNISRFNNISSKTHWENMALNLTYSLDKSWLLSLKNDLYNTENNFYYFLNLTINYQPKDSNFSYQLIANNLTNQNSFSNTIVNDYTIYNSNIKLLPRYIYTSVKYRF